MAQPEPDDLNLDKEQSQKDTSPIPFDDSDGPETKILHSPLNLGGGGSAPVPAAKPAPKQAATQPPAAAAPKPAPAAPSAKPVTVQQTAAPSAGRITGVKIFFTKLHAGAMDFLSEQISDWLKENPKVVVKHTNITVGEVAAKKTEQNLIITVWY
jgi:hypothetical protein